MQIRVSVQSGVPIYQQIVGQVKYLVAGGRLRPGDDLPPIRHLAEQLRVNPNTVARAYLELEREGMITMRQGSGTQVAAGRSGESSSAKLKMLNQAADALLADARRLDLNLEEVVELLRARNDRLQSEAAK